MSVDIFLGEKVSAWIGVRYEAQRRAMTVTELMAYLNRLERTLKVVQK